MSNFRSHKSQRNAWVHVIRLLYVRPWSVVVRTSSALVRYEPVVRHRSPSPLLYLSGGSGDISMTKNSKCVVPYCGHAQQHYKQCIYARFPKNLERCRLWIKLAGVEDLVHLKPETLNNIRYICGCHFTDDQFSNKSRKHLKRNAVPSIFDQRVVPLTDGMMIDFASFMTDESEQPILPIEDSGTALLAVKNQFVSAPIINPSPPTNDSASPGANDVRGTIDREHESINDDNNRPCVKAPGANPSRPRVKRYRPSVAVRRMTKKKLMEISCGGGSEPTYRESKIIKLIQKQSSEFRKKLQTLENCKNPWR